jgi:hypothetical protein
MLDGNHELDVLAKAPTLREQVEDYFTFSRLPGFQLFVECCFSGAVEPQDGEEASSGSRCEPVGFVANRCFRAEIGIGAAIAVLEMLFRRARGQDVYGSNGPICARLRVHSSPAGTKHSES